MTTIALTVYILMWPVGVAAVLCVISRGFFREWAEARRKGDNPRLLVPAGLSDRCSEKCFASKTPAKVFV
ncbi:putative transporter small subunit [Streptomyces diastaticus]|uniref:putative transporter small subunit n=1 Tax=Streptomyces diastaticus TaxID=1956 RepID=UPI00365E6AA4